MEHLYFFRFFSHDIQPHTYVYYADWLILMYFLFLRFSIACSEKEFKGESKIRASFFFFNQAKPQLFIE